MFVQVSNFDALIRQEWPYPPLEPEAKDTQLWLCSPNRDISGGRITVEDIDKLADYPDARSVTIMGLDQQTFEYFIQTYGKQLRFIEFFKNKRIEDLSPLADLPELEGVSFFSNQRVTKLWNMERNLALRAVELEDFTRLHDLSGIEKAPALEWFGFGNVIWPTATADSYRPFAGTKVKRLSFSGKAIGDGDLSFLLEMPELEVFDCSTNRFTTEQIAWVVANCPNLKGYALAPYIECGCFNEETREFDIPGVIIVGKRKPAMVPFAGNEKKIQRYVETFQKLVKKYKGVPFESI